MIVPFAGDKQEQSERSSGPILAQLKKAEREFRNWQAVCHDIDDIYSLHGAGYGGVRGELDSYGWQDTKLDLFWASYEVLKPAVYARAPQPAVAPMFRDSRLLQNKTAELLERVSTSVFARNSINDTMYEVRDDLLFSGRGVLWLRYDTDDGQQVCIEHLDRTDFLHEPARKWCEVGWVARRAWLTEDDMRERFQPTSGDAYKDAKYSTKRDPETNEQYQSLTQKAGVWEVWHKADNKVYWVTEGVDVWLDEGEPDLDLAGFFPCPRPAYGTLVRRSLIPVPDWERYAIHFNKISAMTGRIYLLLEQVRMMGLIPGGGDVAEAIETVLSSDDDQIIIPVPGAMVGGGSGTFVEWLPLGELANAIQGLIAARTQLIDDFYQLSGISDIMRGATEAEETYGAQRLKAQAASVRVRCKIDELQRIAADAVKIAGEIIAEKFSQQNLLDMSQMELLTRKEIKKRVKEIEDAAEGELTALGEQAEQMAMQAAQMPEGQEVDPAEAQAAMQQMQQEILQKYGAMLDEAQSHVPIEDIVDLLRDDKSRSFAFEIASDSTIMPDEQAEKESRNEFLGQFTASTQALMQLAAMGEPGAQLAGEMMKFVLAPYRVGRQLDGAIDAFIDSAPEMAAQMGGGEEGGDLAEASGKLADAEMAKAQAQMAKVEADSALKQAENERKTMELQQKAQNDQNKLMAEAEKLRQSSEANAVKAEEALAKVDLIRAQTMKAMADAGVTISSQQLDEFKSLADIELRTNEAARRAENEQVDRAMQVENQQVERQFRERGENRADMQVQPNDAGGNDDRG